MNYQRIYEQLTAKDMIADYTEKHHIIPRCMGGTNYNSNLVKLTPEAHYVAHQLLVKIYPDNHKLVCAVQRMTTGNRRNNKLYGWLRRKHAESMSTINKGKPAHNKGKPPSDETRAKISAALKGKPAHNKGIPLSVETKKKMSIANTGKPMLPSTKEKLSIAHKGKPSKLLGRERSPETKEKLRIASTGRTHSTESRAKLSAAGRGRTPYNKGILQPTAICPHCSKEGGSSLMKRYHFDNCKLIR